MFIAIECEKKSGKLIMKFFLHLVISTIFFNYMTAVERCNSRAHDSVNSWEYLHSIYSSSCCDVNMTKRNLHSINSKLFSEFTAPRDIFSMDLSINRISDIDNGAFERFQNLRVLRMRGNSLREITASQFKGLMMLEELDLSWNAINSIDRDALRHMEHLKTIDLSGNCLYNLRPYIFFRNVRLININLSRNFLNHLPTLMPFSQHINNLNVTDNQFSNLTSLMYYENIQSLDMSHNPLVMKELLNNGTSSTEVKSSSTGSVSTSTSTSKEDGNNYIMQLRYNSNNQFTHRRVSRGIMDNILHPKRISEQNGEIIEMQKKLIRNPRNDRNSVQDVHYVHLSFQQMQQLHEFKRINRLEYFTCRNCSLSSLDFLMHYPKLKYVDVRDNMIKSVNALRLKMLQHIEYLDVSDNKALEPMSIDVLFNTWPKFRTLIRNNNS